TPSKEMNFPNYRSIEAPARKENTMNLTLEQKLKEENARLARIGERFHLLRTAAEAAEVEVNTARAELHTELSTAVMEDREPKTAAFENRVAALHAVFSGKRAELAGAEAARG